MAAAASTSQMVNNLANLLPTGTFMAFQTLAPVFTNDGVCGAIEQAMSSSLVFVFSLICFLLSFTDSLTLHSTGHVFYGIVTPRGLYHPRFKETLRTDTNFYVDPRNPSKYRLKASDFLYASLSVVVFCALALLTPPLQPCLYSAIPRTITKTVPILVSLIVGIVFGFSPPARHGVGYSNTTLTQSLELNPVMALAGDGDDHELWRHSASDHPNKQHISKPNHAVKLIRRGEDGDGDDDDDDDDAAAKGRWRGRATDQV